MDEECKNLILLEDDIEETDLMEILIGDYMEAWINKTPGNPYNNHWVLATGYVYRKPADNIVLYYKVTDGWGSDNSYVNVSWTDYMVAI